MLRGGLCGAQHNSTVVDSSAVLAAAQREQSQVREDLQTEIRLGLLQVCETSTSSHIVSTAHSQQTTPSIQATAVDC